MAGPLVTCVMITKPNAVRLPFVVRAAGAYARQTYEPRELLVLLDAGSEGDRGAVEAGLASMGRNDIRIVRTEGAPSLGRLRNLGIELAHGELVCVWDDDDFHHPTRVESQVRTLRDRAAIATFLTDVLHLFVATRKVYWTTYKPAVQKCVPGAGLFRRSVAARYPEEGPDSLRGEDTAFCLRLFSEGRVHLVDDSPHLYIYVNHGHNTSGEDFHRMVASTLAVSRGRVSRGLALVKTALDAADHGLDEIQIMGSNGLAFSWQRGASCLKSP
jgi:glycosyltransferase involved in cell wall biosynthesis